MPTVSFKTLGCRLNQAETARMKAGFVSAGYCIEPFTAVTDVAVIHTCTITGMAEKECIRLARRVKRRSPDACVVLAGCAVEVGRDTLLEASGADLLAGQNEKFDLPTALASRISPATPAPVTDDDAPPVFDTTRAWIKVQDGCDFRCAYCIVPDARGGPHSRGVTDVMHEASQLVEQGYRELVVTGANLGCYADGDTNLVGLLDQLETLDGLRRLRISSIELSTVESDVIAYMARSTKLCRFLHLPLQTGDDRMLRAMGRHYTSADYRAVVHDVTSRLPRVGLGADIITGLPGEDEEAFRNTCRLVEDLPFSNLHVFPYSPRPGTPAADMTEQVPRDVARARAAELIALGKEKRNTFARSLLGHPLEVLVERLDDEGAAHGWTGEYIAARVRGEGLQPNQLVAFTPTAYDGALYA